mgnify:CR=1 FL=1
MKIGNTEITMEALAILISGLAIVIAMAGIVYKMVSGC